MNNRALAVGLAVFLLVSGVNAQRAEVTVSLNETFFDALLDSAFQNFAPPEFSIAGGNASVNERAVGREVSWPRARSLTVAFRPVGNSICPESIKILREMNGVRTAVRFREGKIFLPLVFSGNYAPPFIGCVEFGGWAETNIDLEFDQAGQRLIGRARVSNVNLSGTGGVGSTMIAKLLQRSIDSKLNPIEIIRLDKLSFGVPVQNGGNLRMKATSIRPEIVLGSLNIRVIFEFLKS
ncbi:MAG: hypothetical protein ACKVRN_07055 [Pyrinomonadaceae bacterium]